MFFVITCKVERYSISGLHDTVITAIEWSKNGMKLFSGDKDGLVVLTEIDFYMVSNIYCYIFF